MFGARSLVALWASAELVAAKTCGDECKEAGKVDGNIIGTAPSCAGNCENDCPNGLCFIATDKMDDYGAGCWSGNKVCCCIVKAVEDTNTTEPKSADPNGFTCDICKEVLQKGIDAGVAECKVLCKKAGSLDGVCEQACDLAQTQCDGSEDCAAKVCGLVKLCGNDAAPAAGPDCTRSPTSCSCFIERDHGFCKTCGKDCGPCKEFCSEGGCKKSTTSCSCFVERDPNFCNTCTACGPCNDYCKFHKNVTIKDDPNDITCDLCKEVLKKGIDAGVAECKTLCQKLGPLDGTCEQACDLAQTECDGTEDCAGKVCGLVKLCGNGEIVV